MTVHDATTAINTSSIDMARIASGVELILRGLGEDITRDGLKDTPDRVARFFAEWGQGYRPGAILEPLERQFDVAYDDVVWVRDIAFTSLCEHHLLPFRGVAHIGYQPQQGRVTGLSKLARVVNAAAGRLQVQERMTGEIADAIDRVLKPRGVFVKIEAEHLCMTIRGVHKPGTVTVTTSARGTLRERDAETE
ncbi:MAG: GTP cyclohydrolase I FolE [Firmicutes bacterium]|nr:GTP cyclohydrolase I FolE [Bacillota bacterium]